MKYEWNSNSDADKSYLDQGWPTSKGREHQMVNFLREGSAGGTLYLAGARGGIDIATARIGDDILDLYRVDDVGGAIRLKWITSRTKNSHSNADPTAAPGILTKGEANFAAASGFYVSPSRELLFYATEHANGGPSGSVRVGEWRHIDMVRPNSPTLPPSAKFLGPLTVDEGAETFLGGLGEGPLTKAWIQLFGNTSYSERYVVVDFSDQERDNFENFKRLVGTVWDDISLDPHFGFNDEAQSWRARRPEPPGDPDQGVSAVVPVLSPQQALNDVIAQRNQLLSVTTNPHVRKQLRSALPEVRPLPARPFTPRWFPDNRRQHASTLAIGSSCWALANLSRRGYRSRLPSPA